MSQTTPQQSPIRASASQEDKEGYELIDDDLAIQDEEDRFMSDGSHSQDSQDRASLLQVKGDVVHQDRSDILNDQRRQQTRTPEPKQRQSQRTSTNTSPGRLAPFDWEDFEARYQKALADADDQESCMLEEFEHLVKYFNVWASASSTHDNERAIKRLQTRTRYVHISEEKLKQKKEHLSEVVKAFQSALALLKAQ